MAISRPLKSRKKRMRKKLPALVAQCVKGLLPRESNREVVGSSPGCDPCSIRK